MKQTKLLFLMLISLLMSFPLTSCGGDDEPDEPTYEERDYSAKVNGIAYKVIDTDKLTCEVVAATSPNNYQGSITIPSKVSINGRDFTVVQIGDGSFSYSEIQSISLPNTIEVIEIWAFTSCKKLTSIQFPSSVKKIGVKAFYGSGLTSVTIPASVEMLGESSFNRCNNLKEVTIADSKSPLLHISKSASSSQTGAFSGSPLEVFYIGRNLKCCDESAPSTLRYINGYIVDSSDLKQVTIGADVTTLDNYRLLYYHFSTYISKTTSPLNIWNWRFSNEEYMKTKVYVPTASLERYKENSQWGKFWNIEAIK